MKRFYKILTGNNKKDLLIINALLNVPEISLNKKRIIEDIQKNKYVKQEDYEIIDDACARAYLDASYRDYIKAEQKLEGIDTIRLPSSTDTLYSWGIKTFATPKMYPQQIESASFNILRRLKKMRWHKGNKRIKMKKLAPILTYKEFTEY